MKHHSLPLACLCTFVLALRYTPKPLPIIIQTALLTTSCASEQATYDRHHFRLFPLPRTSRSRFCVSPLTLLLEILHYVLFRIRMAVLSETVTTLFVQSKYVPQVRLGSMLDNENYGFSYVYATRHAHFKPGLLHSNSMSCRTSLKYGSVCSGTRLLVP